MLDEHLKFDLCDYLFAESGGRALSSLISKFNIFTHLFYTCVSPILLYVSEACGSNKLKKCDQIQHRAMRFFPGVHKYAPILGLQCCSTIILTIHIWLLCDVKSYCSYTDYIATLFFLVYQIMTKFYIQYKLISMK